MKSQNEIVIMTKNKLLSKIDEANDKLSNSPIIKGLIDGGLSLIPVLGSVISSSLDTRSFQLFEENSKRFAEEVRKIVSNLDENKLDKDFLESSEFTSLLIETLARNAKVHENAKVKLFAKAFIGFTTINGSQIPYKEGFIKIIDELDLNHINILAFIYKHTKAKDQLVRKITSKEISSRLKIPNGRVQAYCEQMMRYGLIRDWGIGRLDYEPGYYVVTEYGSEFSEFLSSFLT